MKLLFTKHQIRDMATNGKVYLNARHIVNHSKIEALTFDPLERILRAVIYDIDGKINKVAILIKSVSEIGKTSCSCRRYSPYLYGLCEHQIALILSVLDSDLNNYTGLVALKNHNYLVSSSLKRSKKINIANHSVSKIEKIKKSLSSDIKDQEKSVLSKKQDFVLTDNNNAFSNLEINNVIDSEILFSDIFSFYYGKDGYLKFENLYAENTLFFQKKIFDFISFKQDLLLNESNESNESNEFYQIDLFLELKKYDELIFTHELKFVLKNKSGQKFIISDVAKFLKAFYNGENIKLSESFILDSKNSDFDIFSISLIYFFRYIYDFSDIFYVVEHVDRSVKCFVDLSLKNEGAESFSLNDEKLLLLFKFLQYKDKKLLSDYSLKDLSDNVFFANISLSFDLAILDIQSNYKNSYIVSNDIAKNLKKLHDFKTQIFIKEYQKNIIKFSKIYLQDNNILFSNLQTKFESDTLQKLFNFILLSQQYRYDLRLDERVLIKQVYDFLSAKLQHLSVDILQAVLDLDLDKQGIFYKLTLKYGMVKNSYTHKEILAAYDKEKLLNFYECDFSGNVFIRNFDEEIKIIKLLADTPFSLIDNNEAYIVSIQKSYEFLKYYLPILEKYLIIKKSSSFNMLELFQLNLDDIFLDYSFNKAQLNVKLVLNPFLNIKKIQKIYSSYLKKEKFFLLDNYKFLDLSAEGFADKIKLLMFLIKKSLQYVEMDSSVLKNFKSDKMQSCLNFSLPSYYIFEIDNIFESYKTHKTAEYLDFFEIFTSDLFQPVTDSDNLQSNNSNNVYINENLKIWFEEHKDNIANKLYSSDEKVRILQNVLKMDKLNPGLKTIMKSYQVKAYQWLQKLAYFNFGGILADDMGLGKTLQILSFLEADFKETQGNILVILPASLTYNWFYEIKKYNLDLPCLIYEGSVKERRELFEGLKHKSRLILVSYGILRQDIDLLSQLNYSVCVIDEAQSIKNPCSQISKQVKKIAAKHRFALSGTPIENRLGELWSIFDFLMPNYLGSYREFKEKFELPISKFQDKDVLEDLQTKLSHFILRRNKVDVLPQLPEKYEQNVYCPMSNIQRKLYNEELNTFSHNDKAFEILSKLMRLRQIACHPHLVKNIGLIKNEQGSGALSGKLDVLIQYVLNFYDDGHSCLIFSAFTSMLKIIAEELSKYDITYFYLDGSTKAEERLSLVNRFNNGEVKIFLISLKAGGTGLNLTGADTVFHVDPWWNPAVEIQASDRAHRLGQKNKLQIYRFICKNSIEESILNLQNKKNKLFKDILSCMEEKNNQSINLDDLQNLVSQAVKDFCNI